VEHDVSAADGRTLRVLEEGDPNGHPILIHHGTPGSRLQFKPAVVRGRQQGLRLISYDRPGYGGSSRHEGRSVGDCAADVRAIAAALEIDGLAVWGISGGGPHALACAALLPDLVPAVASLAAPAPWGAEGLDYLADTGELNVEDTELFFEDRAAAEQKCAADRDEMYDADKAEIIEILLTLLSPVDAAVLSGELGDYLVEQEHLGLAPGYTGWWDDGVALLTPWGFELETIKTPVLLLQGRHDKFVPFAHGEWLAGQIPSVEPRLSEDDGHLTLMTDRLDDVQAWLVDRL
jgi:pimeloyl-ACP methyl ester carboxylesterase